ncbi:MAG: HypC/HybG/HupF family hydrogenase formation chaperone [Thauera phenolivorans]|uniref:HypC/HybG/HupF family hydrogenase formation chaperone n=1 Tax=Thauera phenolivorans TaxID=1792543 RepID=A0A7X7LW53_9RHOO|nr:HypC/HybG/HupF family hydrogenase formation chaperone [Thauera phenolivorans]NLF54354.1 HypC/HybG/HupF family hydrogenase formation chaperone [Thauera phenolivorans]
MCLAIPARVVALVDGDEAVVDLDGVRKRISLALVEEVGVGDYVILHVGFALQKLDQAEAEATLALLREIAAAEAGQGAGDDGEAAA